MKNKKIYLATSRPIGERCRKWAIENGFCLVNTLEECDIIISVLYDTIFKEEQLKNKKSYNFHPGILPQYRGSGLSTWVIIYKEKEHGITLHEITPEIDAGNVIDIQRFPIPKDWTAEDLFYHCEEVIFLMFCNWLENLCDGNFKYIQSGNNFAPIYYRKYLNEAKDLTHIIRAFTFTGKESAYYFTKDGRKVVLDYVNGPSCQ
jgi:methionyl-tRNA formyltransferase